MIKRIRARDFCRLPKEEQDQFYLLDVRTDKEYQSGHIPRTKHIPHDQIEARYQELAHLRTKKILIICRSGKRSLFAAKVLAAKGFQEVYNLEGGMLAWRGELEP